MYAVNVLYHWLSRLISTNVINNCPSLLVTLYRNSISNLIIVLSQTGYETSDGKPILHYRHM